MCWCSWGGVLNEKLPTSFARRHLPQWLCGLCTGLQSCARRRLLTKKVSPDSSTSAAFLALREVRGIVPHQSTVGSIRGRGRLFGKKSSYIHPRRSGEGSFVFLEAFFLVTLAVTRPSGDRLELLPFPPSATFKALKLA
eukprot:1295130-Amphidinium_carterae.1